MAVALTSFVQPMLIGNQSSDSSLQIEIVSSKEDEIDHIRKDGRPPIVCPSPSPSRSPSESPITSASPSNESLISCKSHRKDSTPYSDIIDIEFDTNDNNTEYTKNKRRRKGNHGKTKTIDYNDNDDNDDEDDDDDNNNNNDEDHGECGDDKSVSMSQCRYCYSDIPIKSSVSQCHCSGVLCRQCLINELKLTHGRADSLLQCTVCKNEYDVKTEFKFKIKKDCKSLCIDYLIHCGLKDEQYLLDSVGGKIGFFLVILGINTWILSTSLLFAFPPNGCPIELYYMVSIFDFAVGVSTIWFIVKCRYLSPLFLSIMYFIRFIYILLGWIPSINLCNIYMYHDHENNHISILSYFLSFSFIASVIMSICWIFDLNVQYKKYKKKNGKLVLNKNNIKIEINDIIINNNDVNNEEHDEY